MILLSKINTNKILVLVLILGFLFSIQVVFGYAAVEEKKIPEVKTMESNDLKGNWAEFQIENWVEKGILKGYGDNTIRPDKPITRAEFVTLVNKVFGYISISKKDISFSDITKKDWSYNQFSNAVYLGYISGYGDGSIKPNNMITREQAFTIITKLMDLNTSEGKDEIDNFSDVGNVSKWSKPYLNAAIQNGYLEGGRDGTLNPTKYITRAEAVVLLSNVAGEIFSKDDEPAPDGNARTINGNVTVNAPGVTLKDLSIKGSLYLTEGIQNGNATLDNVTVAGRTLIRGGGEHSIIIKNSHIEKMEVEKLEMEEKIRIRLMGEATVKNVVLNSAAKLETEDSAGTIFSSVVVDMKNTNNVGTSLTAGQNSIEFSGNFENVSVNSSAFGIAVTSGNIGNLLINKTAANALVTVSGGNVSVLNILASKSNITVKNGTIGIVDIAKEASQTKIDITGGKIEQIFTSAKTDIEVDNGEVGRISVNSFAAGSNVDIKASASISVVSAGAEMNITGTGKVDTIYAKASGVVVNTVVKPDNVIVGNNVDVVVNNQIISKTFITTTVPQFSDKYGNPPTASAGTDASLAGFAGANVDSETSSTSKSGNGNITSNKTSSNTDTSSTGSTKTSSDTDTSSAGSTGSTGANVTSNSTSEQVVIYSEADNGGRPTSQVKVQINGAYITVYSLYFDNTSLATSSSDGIIIISSEALHDLSRIRIMYNSVLNSVNSNIPVSTWP